MAFSPKVKEDAVVACGRRCCLCHKFCGVNMEVHHIKQEADGGSNDISNAIPLCFDCHANVRAYNSRHPKGIKYTESELIRHRDRWYKKIQDGPISYSSEEFLELDRQTYNALKEYLQHGDLVFFREIDFGGHFISMDRLNRIRAFPEKADDPLFEYVDADLETAKANLASSINQFSANSLPFLHSDDGKRVMIPRDWMVTRPDNFDKAAELLNKDSFVVWYKYCDYIRICRQKLKITGE